MREPVAANPRGPLARLENEYPESQALFRLVERCGLHLARVLKGDLGPLPLLFSDDPASSAERIYHDVPFAKSANALFAETIDRVLANRRRRQRFGSWKSAPAREASRHRSSVGSPRDRWNTFSPTSRRCSWKVHARRFAIIRSCGMCCSTSSIPKKPLAELGRDLCRRL